MTTEAPTQRIKSIPPPPIRSSFPPPKENEPVSLSYDELTGNLIVFYENSVVSHTEPSPSDSFILFSSNLGRMIEVEVKGADLMSSDNWRKYKDRWLIDPNLLQKLDNWFYSSNRELSLHGVADLSLRLAPIVDKLNG